MKRFWATLSFLILFGAAAAQAQTYPSRPITLVVPFPPGGSTDAAARIMAERMRATLGQSVVIENVGGAGGSIGVGRVARAAPDGYTFDIGQWDTHVGSIIYKLDYDLEKDFEPIALVSNNPQLLVAKNDLPANTLAELVAWMKDNPGKINFVNQNAAANVTGVMFENLTKQKVQFIPYRGAGPAMTDLISGTVDLLVVQGAVALPQIRAGKIKALANLSATRSASMPDIPTADETGVPGLYMSGWFGFWAPKGTPKDVVAKLNGAMMQVLADPTTQSKFAELGLDVASSKRRKGSPNSSRPRSTSGGRSSRRRTSRASETRAQKEFGRTWDEKNTGCRAGAVRWRDHRRAGADVPIEAGHHHRAVRGGRADRCAGAGGQRAHARLARPDRRHRERHRRGRYPRRDPFRARAGRRLHHQHGPSRHPRDQRRDLSAAVRSDRGSRASRAARLQSDADRQQERGACQGPQGIDRLAEGQPGQGHNRHRRRRLRRAFQRRLFPEPDRNQDPLCGLSRHWPGVAGPGRRPDRSHRRPGLELAAPGAGRTDQGLWRDRHQAARRCAGDSNGG